MLEYACCQFDKMSDWQAKIFYRVSLFIDLRVINMQALLQGELGVVG